MSAKVVKTDAEWQAKLSNMAFKVARQHGTERAFSNDNFSKSVGVFHCICCDAPLFYSAAKFDSGTGWPSLYEPIAPEALGETVDSGFFMRRTEVHCARCDAHMGHVFPDGPEPTGLRYCINGVVLQFKNTEGV
jgi:peptide-methionine (R)-S-oxide reductase